MTTAYERRDSVPPRRGLVFGQIWWRSMALATAGGGVIGLVGFPVAVFADGDLPKNVLYVIYAAWIGAVFGAAVGLVLGLAAGLLLGCVGAIWLVPYRGESATVKTVRLVATATVAVWFPLLTQTNVYTNVSSLGVWAIIVPALIGAWFISPWGRRMVRQTHAGHGLANSDCLTARSRRNHRDERRSLELITADLRYVSRLPRAPISATE